MMNSNTTTDIQKRAIAFSHRWKEIPGDEEQQTQVFFIDFFKIWDLNILEMSPFERRVKLEDGSMGRIDCILDGVLLIEQKNPGVDLNAAYKQALSYIPGLKPEVVPKFVMVCDFCTFRLYDKNSQASSNPQYIEFTLEKLHEHIDSFNFLSGICTKPEKK